jgi:hypothetical protein
LASKIVDCPSVRPTSSVKIRFMMFPKRCRVISDLPK